MIVLRSLENVYKEFDTLRHQDFSNINFTGHKFKNRNFCRSNFAEALIDDCVFENCTFTNASFMWSNITYNAKFINCTFWNTIGDNNFIFTMQTGAYTVVHSKQYNFVQIGCQCHTPEDWAEFDDDEIHDMDSGEALTWWEEWKPKLEVLGIIPELDN